MNEETRRSAAEHAWRYFTIHADQRLKAFNFFLVFATIISGIMLAIVKDVKNCYAAAPFGVLLTVLAIIFWKLDVRTKTLIWHAEAALKCLEEQFEVALENNCPHVIQVFLREDHFTKIARRRHRWWHLSYSDCFNFVFLMFGICGVTSAIWLIAIGKSTEREREGALIPTAAVNVTSSPSP